MLVEVNLLPEKQKKDVTLPVIILIILILIGSSALGLRSFHQTATLEVETLKQEINELQLLSTTTQQEIIEKSLSQTGELEQAINALHGEILPASFLLDHLVSLLPERGFFLNFDYSIPRDVYFDASFDQLDEVAQYSNALFQSAAVDEVQLTSITTNPLLTDAELNRDKYLPRYIASFSLKINPSVVREMRDDT